MNLKVISKGILNIRSGPGIDYADLGDLKPGEILISPDITGWLPFLIEEEDGSTSTGWVKAEFVQEVPEEIEEPEEPKVAEDAEIDLPIFQRDLMSTFGNPGAPTFAQEYLSGIDLSEFQEALSHVKNFHHSSYFGFYGNRLLAGPLKKALRAVCEKGLSHELKTFDGCFCIRKMKGGNNYSVHSWGLAIDLNAATNPFGKRLITDFSDEFVSCFTRAGFEWGGAWNNVKDAMHFQLPWTKDWR